MEVFAMIVACILVLGLTAFILVTLYTIVRDLIKRKNNKNSNRKENKLNEEGGKN